MRQPVVFIHTVSASKDQMTDPFQREDITVSGKEQIGICWFIPYIPSVPHFCFIGGAVLRPDFMVPMNTEDDKLQFTQSLFHIFVPPVKGVIGPDITQRNDDIITFQIKGSAELDDLTGISSESRKHNQILKNVVEIRKYEPEVRRMTSGFLLGKETTGSAGGGVP